MTDRKAEAIAKIASMTPAEVAAHNAAMEEKFQSQLAEDDKREAAEISVAMEFDPEALMRESSVIKAIKDPILGIVHYGELTVAENMECAKIQDLNERSYRMLHIMLQKAYPNITYEQIIKMPQVKVARLSALIAREVNVFLLPPRYPTAPISKK